MDVKEEFWKTDIAKEHLVAKLVVKIDTSDESSS